MTVIEIDNITKDYGSGKGVFDLSFGVNKGEIMGFLGPNGAGKTTTIRQLLGFTKPDSGSVYINGLDCFKKSDVIAESLGYLPGEIAFMDDMTGAQFIKFIAEMKKLKDMKRADELCKFFELDTSGKIKKMSKGMKQKLGIVCAFMQNPEIAILDEPTSGLDPLMQEKFIQLLKDEQEKGTTILMSSHIFEEIEKVCARAEIIKDGKLVSVEDVEKLQKSKVRTLEITFEQQDDAKAYAKIFDEAKTDGNVVSLRFAGNIDKYIKAAAAFTVSDIDVHTQSLEELFMHFYKGEEK